MKFLRNLNPFYWRHKARCLQDQLDNVAEARLRQEQEIVKYHKKWLEAEGKVTELQDLVPDYSLPENAELASYLFRPHGERLTAREAKMLLDLDQLRSQLELANEERPVELLNKVEQQRISIAEQRKRLDELHRELFDKNEELTVAKTALDKERKQNERWFKAVLGFGVNEGILMNAALRGKDLAYIDVYKDLGGKDES